MRISDVFVMGGGNGYGGGGPAQGLDCYSTEHFCYRSYDSRDKYDSPRSHRHGLAHILGSYHFGDGVLGLLRTLRNH